MPTYTIQQVAREFQVHPHTVKQWVKQGKIRAMRLGHRTLRITQEELDYIKAHGLREPE